MLRLNVPFIGAMLIAACVTGLIGLLVGLPSLRLTGSYLTIVTLGFVISAFITGIAGAFYAREQLRHPSSVFMTCSLD